MSFQEDHMNYYYYKYLTLYYNVIFDALLHGSQ